MKFRIPILERIWRVKSSLTLAEPLTPDEVFKKLDPLFCVEGTQATVVDIDGAALSYTKKNPAAQDKLSTFTSGTLRVDQAGEETRLSYELTSTALFLCFLAPLFFLAFAQLATFINELEKPTIVAEMEQKEKEAKNEEPVELHWIDKTLGAPGPKQPGQDDKSEEDEAPEGKHSPITAYVLAGVFFTIFCVGRVLEPYLVKRTFCAHLRPSHSADQT